MTALLVFSDLDGTLLTHDSYDWRPAAAALAELARRRVPLVLASSKTRVEIELWRARLALDSPFISENGGALYVPWGFFRQSLAGAESTGGYARLALGAPYAELRHALTELAVECALPLRGFGDMAVEEIAQRTGLDPASADLARQREFDEPFLVLREPAIGEWEQWEALAAAVARRGLRLTRGGRFLHLTGPNDKGIAARILTAHAAAEWGATTTVALGDSANDLELLAAADLPVVVAGPDGTHDPTLSSGLPHARFTAGAGPVGFAEAILALLTPLP